MNYLVFTRISRLAWVLPVLVWLAAFGYLIGRNSPPPAASPAPVIAPIGLATIQPGFTAKYDPATSHWSWQYARVMDTGCQQLIMPIVNPVTYDEPTDIVHIELKTYSTDDTCTKPAAIAAFTGGISTDPNTTFTLSLDGKQIVP
ncbi:MAG: hypothetical protein WCO52_00035 [bacterium]